MERKAWFTEPKSSRITSTQHGRILSFPLQISAVTTLTPSWFSNVSIGTMMALMIWLVCLRSVSFFEFAFSSFFSFLVPSYLILTPAKLQTTVNEMKTKRKFSLINPKKVSRKGYTDSGELSLDIFEVQPIPKFDPFSPVPFHQGWELVLTWLLFSFLDYLRGGCEIGLMVAIDFTASNGKPSSSDSLHYQDPNGPNEYMQAIMGVGNVLEPYDYDRQFPVLSLWIIPFFQTPSKDNHCNRSLVLEQNFLMELYPMTSIVT